MKKFTSLIFVASLFACEAFAEKCPFKSIGINCCKNANAEVTFTDVYGNYGTENGERCGIIDDSCWSLKYGYLCCSSDSFSIIKTDKHGLWGRENKKWCGIRKLHNSEGEDADSETSEGGAQTVNSLMLDEGGSGPYKAVMTEEKGLPNFTIYRPENLKAAAKTEGPLPVILFANGGCSRISLSYANYLTEIASHGYVIAAVGKWANEDNKENDTSLNFTDEIIAGFKMDAEDLVSVALAWLEKENMNKESIFYKTMNTENVGAVGHSCGGLQALIIGTKDDKRIQTTVALNSGANSPGDLLATLIVKDELQSITKPIIYVTGGVSDIAHNNAVDDFGLITKVPVALAIKESAGHDGTYGYTHGGTFAVMTLAWLDYTLKNDQSYDDLFRKSIIPSNLEGWTIEQKNF